MNAINIHAANAEALDRMLGAEPVVVGVAAARDCIPGFADNLILTSGAPLAWPDYHGGQRAALIGAALYEGLAESEEDAERKFASCAIRIGVCHDYGCVGSVAGIYTASMPVFIVRNATRGNIGYCNLYEGKTSRRLNYGIYDDEVKFRLDRLRDIVAPVIGRAIERAGGIELKPIIRSALNMGDELHSRNTAASLLFTNALFPHILEMREFDTDTLKQVLGVLTEDNYFFLRLSMAAAKATADAARDIPGSTVVTAMAMNGTHFAIRVSGLGDEWIIGPEPSVDAKFFAGFTRDDIAWMGGESVITETIGLGGFAQAASFPLQDYQGGSPEKMIDTNLKMYEITVGENTDYKIPYFGFRGTPTAIDFRKVLATGILPVVDAGLGGKGGGQIGAGIIRVPMECFEGAARAFIARYGSF